VRRRSTSSASTLEGRSADKRTGFRECVRPQKNAACPFVIHAQSEDEISIEFGAFSVAHPASTDLSAVSDACSELIDHLIAGDVREVVWLKKGRPRRAVAYVGVGSDATTFHTRQGLCLRSECHGYQYEGYR
jgi:hypothetical protein